MARLPAKPNGGEEKPDKGEGGENIAVNRSYEKEKIRIGYRQRREEQPTPKLDRQNEKRGKMTEILRKKTRGRTKHHDNIPTAQPQKPLRRKKKP